MSFSQIIEARETRQFGKIRNALEIDGTLPFTENFLYQLHLEVRFTDSKAKLDEVFETVGIGYKLRPNLVFWVAYDDYQDVVRGTNARFTFEHRPWQAIQWGFYDSGTVQLTSLTRFEQRFFQTTHTWEYRLRERLILSLPEFIKEKYTPTFYQEFFFDVTPNNGSNLIPENRVFAGVAIPTTQKTSLTVGYLNQFQIMAPTNAMSHTLYLTFTVRP